MRKRILPIFLDESVQNLPLNNSNFAVRELGKFFSSLNGNDSDYSIERNYGGDTSDNEVALVSTANTMNLIKNINYLSDELQLKKSALGEDFGIDIGAPGEVISTQAILIFRHEKNTSQERLRISIDNLTRLESPDDKVNIFLPDDITPGVLGYLGEAISKTVALKDWSSELGIFDTAKKSAVYIKY